MDEDTRTAIQATFEASNKGQIHFGEVIARRHPRPWLRTTTAGHRRGLRR